MEYAINIKETLSRNAGINDSFFIGSSICHVFRHLWNCHKKTGILRGPFD